MSFTGGKLSIYDKGATVNMVEDESLELCYDEKKYHLHPSLSLSCLPTSFFLGLMCTVHNCITVNVDCFVCIYLSMD